MSPLAWTLNFIKFYFKITSFLGTFPCDLHITTGMLELESKKRKRYYATISIFVVVRIAVLGSFINAIYYKNINLSYKKDILHLLYRLISFYTLGNHLHHLWKLREMLNTFNAFITFYKAISGKIDVTKLCKITMT